MAVSRRGRHRCKGRVPDERREAFQARRPGKRRLHKRPTAAEADACHPWLDAELKAVRACVVVALGAVAARAVTGQAKAVAASRGQPFDVGGRVVFITYHPSAVLRRKEDAAEIRSMLVADLRSAGAAAGLAIRRVGKETSGDGNQHGLGDR